MAAPATLERPPSRRRVMRRMPDWYAAGVGGLAGGLAFMAVEMVLAPLFGQGRPWDAPRLITAVIFGDLLSGRSQLAVETLALFTHLSLSLIYGRVLGLFLFARPKKEWPHVGLLFGLGLYVLNYYLLGAFIPRIAAARSGSWLFCHLVFGFVAAWAYSRLERLEREI